VKLADAAGMSTFLKSSALEGKMGFSTFSFSTSRYGKSESKIKGRTGR
jgi:hypothetical protein